MKSRINTDAREISIIELFWYVISKWKCLIVGFVVGALLLCGFEYYSNYKAEKQQDIQQNLQGNNTTEELWDSFTDKGKQQIELAAELYERYMEEYNNIDFNYIMTMDVDNVDRVLLQYKVDTDYVIDYNGITTENYINDVLKMYVSAVRTQEFRTDVMELGIDNLEEKDINYLVSASYTGKVLEFSIYGHGNDSIEIAKIVKNTIDNSYESITSGVGKHSITLLSEDNTQVYSTVIKNAQETKRSDLKTLQESCSLIDKKMTEEQKAVYEILKNQVDYKYTSTETIAEEEVNKSNIFSLIVKPILMGGLIGLAAAFVILILIYIVSRKIRSISDVEQVYNITLLGKILEYNSKKSCRYFDRKRNGFINNSTTDEQIVYTVKTIISKCQSEEINNVCISYDSMINKEIAEQIVNQIKACGIKVKSGSCVYGNIETLEAAIECKNIILIGKLDCTRKFLIEEEIKTCDKLNINIVGMLVTI